MSALSVDAALAALSPEPGLVVLMCGVAGSGKTTFSQALAARGFTRLSIDEEIWNTSGRYGVDYPAEAYGSKVAAAREAIRAQLATLMAERTPAVVDSAFWSRTHRDDFKALIEAAGGHCQIVYLRVPETELRVRIEARRARFDANAALPIDETTLAGFLRSFEEPQADEGAMVVG